MNQILHLHRNHELSLSDITRIVGDQQLTKGKGSIGSKQQLVKKFVFSNTEDFVKVLRLISGVDSQSVEGSENGEDEVDKPSESSSSEDHSPPTAFCYKYIPKIVVEETADDKLSKEWLNDVSSGEIWHPLTASDLCSPEFDFYERCGNPDIDCSEVEGEGGADLLKLDSENMVKESSDKSKAETALSVSTAVDKVSRDVEASDTSALTNETEQSQSGTMGGGNTAKQGGQQIVCGCSCSKPDNNPERSGTGAEGTKDLGSDEDRVVVGHMGRIEEVEEDEPSPTDLVGQEERSSTSKQTSQGGLIAPRVQTAVEESELKPKGVPPKSEEPAKVDALKLNVEKACSLCDEPDAKPDDAIQMVSGEGKKSEPGPGGVEEGKIDTESPDPDSGSDIPSVIEVRPLGEGSLEDVADELSLPERGIKTLVIRYRPPDRSPSPGEELLKIDEGREDRTDTNEDLRNIHSEKWETIDHLSSQVTDEVESCRDDNEDDRSISPAPCAVDHLVGVDRLTRVTNIGSVVSVGDGEEHYGPEMASSHHSFTEGSKRSSLFRPAACSSGLDDTPSDSTHVNTWSGMERTKPSQSFEESSLKVSHSTPLHRTEPLTDVSRELSTAESFSHKVDVSHSEVHRGGRTSRHHKNISVASSAVLDTFAADVQTIYGSAVRSDSSVVAQVSSTIITGDLDQGHQFATDKDLLVQKEASKPEETKEQSIVENGKKQSGKRRPVQLDNTAVLEQFASSVQAIYSSSQHNQTEKVGTETAPVQLANEAGLGPSGPSEPGQESYCPAEKYPEPCEKQMGQVEPGQELNGKLEPGQELTGQSAPGPESSSPADRASPHQKTIQLFHGEHIVQPSDTEPESSAEEDSEAQKDPRGVESVSMTTQTDDSHEGLGTGVVVRHRKLTRLGGSSRAGPSTTLMSNIHVGFPSSILEVDIALQKTVYTSEPADQQPGGQRQGDAQQMAAQVSSSQGSGSEREEEEGTVRWEATSFMDRLNYVMSFMDLLFWFGMALAIAVFEMCRRGM